MVYFGVIATLTDHACDITSAVWVMSHSTPGLPSSTRPDSSVFRIGSRAHLEGVCEEARVFRMTCGSVWRHIWWSLCLREILSTKR